MSLLLYLVVVAGCAAPLLMVLLAIRPADASKQKPDTSASG